MFQADPNSPFTPGYCETLADSSIAESAIEAANIFNGCFNRASAEDLRTAWKGREHEYLYARFADALGWKSHDDAKAFMRKHKRPSWW
jgi:hypothetical protein